MNLQTNINIPENRAKIKHSHKLLTIGSCFSDNIGRLFSYYKFNTLSNPFGTLYNPGSILNSLQLLKNDKKFTENDLFHYNHEWHSFYHHSDFSSHDLKECLDKINQQIILTKAYISKIDYIFITLGTSFVYRSIEKDIIVSNCHKVPANHFERKMLNLQETEKILNSIVNIINKLNKKCRLIFTISPIRYWATQAVENQQSKATLILAINEIVKNNTNCCYFPAYEIMIDELRDYRFYKEDLIHPNNLAIEYIWEKLEKSYFTNKCQTILKELESIIKAFNHKPRNIYSESHQKFINSQLDKMIALQGKYPHLDFTEEKFIFQKQLE